MICHSVHGICGQNVVCLGSDMFQFVDYDIGVFHLNARIGIVEKRQMARCDVSSQLNSNSAKVCKVLHLVSGPNIAAQDFCLD